MAKRGGFPGGGMPGNMNNLMKQAQRMQRQMEESQKELEEKEFTATAGGGAVEVSVSGKREVTKVKLQEEAVDPDDIEMLEDLIMAATNEALRKVDEESANVMGKLTGGLGRLGGSRSSPSFRGWEINPPSGWLFTSLTVRWRKWSGWRTRSWMPEKMSATVKNVLP